MDYRARIEAEGRVLFAAAQADGHVEPAEVERIRAILASEWHDAGLGEHLPEDVMTTLLAFDAKTTSIEDLARPFEDSHSLVRRNLLDLVVKVHEADGELDYEEDTFVRELGLALGLPLDQFQDLLLEIIDEPAPAKQPVAQKPAAKKPKKPAAKKAQKPAARKAKVSPKKKPAGKRAAAKKQPRR